MEKFQQKPESWKHLANKLTALSYNNVEEDFIIFKW